MVATRLPVSVAHQSSNMTRRNRIVASKNQSLFGLVETFVQPGPFPKHSFAATYKIQTRSLRPENRRLLKGLIQRPKNLRFLLPTQELIFGQKCRQVVWHAQHRVVSGIQLKPLRAEPFGRTSLVRFARVGGATAPNYR